jgi:hypothetical protein
LLGRRFLSKSPPRMLDASENFFVEPLPSREILWGERSTAEQQLFRHGGLFPVRREGFDQTPSKDLRTGKDIAKLKSANGLWMDANARRFPWANAVLFS